jgi:hypothetical protein
VNVPRAPATSRSIQWAKPKHRVALSGPNEATTPQATRANVSANPGTSPSGRQRAMVLGDWQRCAVTLNGVHEARTRIHDLGERNHRHRCRCRDSWGRALRRSARDSEANDASCHSDEGECGNPSGHVQTRHPWTRPTRTGAALTAIAIVSPFHHATALQRLVSSPDRRESTLPGSMYRRPGRRDLRRRVSADVPTGDASPL